MMYHRADLTENSSGGNRTCALLCGNPPRISIMRTPTPPLPTLSSFTPTLHIQTEHGDPIPSTSSTLTTTATTAPTPTQAPVQEISWIEFCNRIDGALVPLKELKIRNARFSCFLLVLALILLFLTFMLIKNWMAVKSRLGDWCYFLFFAFFCVPFVGLCYLVNTAKDKEMEIWCTIQGICQEMSCSYLGVRFVLKRRTGGRRCVEVRIASGHENGRVYRPSTPETISSSRSFLEQEEGGREGEECERRNVPV